MALRITRDLNEFVARAEPLLTGPIEHNQLATTVIKARHGAWGHEAPLFAYEAGADGEVHYVALRTPPWPMLTGLAGSVDADELMRLWLAEDAGLTGVIGESRSASAIASAWERASGGEAALSTRTALHVLEEVIEPARQAPGVLRLARVSEREMLIEWEHQFLRDAHIDITPSDSLIDSRFAEAAQFLWDDGGPVSMVVISPSVAGTVRIGPVYTPSEHRGRGYATSAVAAICRRILASGDERCSLFTDLANPTSNRIYAEVGFRRIADWAEYRFDHASGAEAVSASRRNRSSRSL